MIMIDSNILIWYLRGNSQINDELLRLTNVDRLFTSPVVIAEIYAGAKKKEEPIIDDLFTSLYLLEINREIGKTAGHFLNQYSKSHNLEILDALIAASVTYGKMRLWTLNKKHYPMLSKKDFYDFDIKI